jgi:hypothetical protein
LIGLSAAVVGVPGLLGYRVRALRLSGCWSDEGAGEHAGQAIVAAVEGEHV